MTLLTTENFLAFTARLEMLGASPEAAGYVDSYLAAHTGQIPVVEGATAHFLFRAPPGVRMGVGGDWNGFNGRATPLTPLGSDLLHAAQDFAPDARIDYLFYAFPGGEGAPPTSLPDPLNPRLAASGLGVRSELAMPAYGPPPATLAQAGIPTGLLQPASIASAVLRQERVYAVYLPAGYATERGPYPSVYFHDGGEYLAMGAAPVILDNLIATGAIPPLVAVFVPPVARNPEYNANPEYARFFGDELVPALHSQYALDSDPARRAVIGPSMGALAALYLGSRRPDLFGLVGGQSSATRAWGGPDAWDARRIFTRALRGRVRLSLIIGRYEACMGLDRQGQCRDLLTPNRDFRAALTRAGYRFRYAEWAQGHSWGLWRDSLPDVLTDLFAAA